MVLTGIEKLALHTLGKDFGEYRVYDVCKEFGKKNSFIGYLRELTHKNNEVPHYITEEYIQTRGYESPIIFRYVKEYAKEIAKEIDDSIVTAVKAVVEVDEAELIKALKYDRDQYFNGFEMGYKYAVADIVRCKNCIYGHYDPDVGDYDCNKPGLWMSHNGDWFCADGELKEEEEKK